MMYQPYEIEGADRPARFLVVCDHAANTVPDFVNGGTLGLGAQDMARHIAYDVGAAGVARSLAQALNGPAILTNFSRLVIDPNRGEDDPTLVMKLYDGTVIPANRHVDAAELARRLNRLYRPYHTALAELAARRDDTVLVSIHSFTRQLRAVRRARGISRCFMPRTGGLPDPCCPACAPSRISVWVTTSPMAGICRATRSRATASPMSDRIS